jgi:DNA-binding MarR family transcriptional regulator
MIEYDLKSEEKVYFTPIGDEYLKQVCNESNERKKELLAAFVAKHNCQPDEVVLIELPLAMESLKGVPQGYYYVRTRLSLLKHFGQIARIIDKLESMILVGAILESKEIRGIIDELKGMNTIKK